jgi:succinyl-CoA synthetase beta subunit
MKLQEYQAKRMLREHGMPVPPGSTACTPGEVVRIAAEVGYPVALKAQVRVAGRGKAGGIRFAADEEEARSIAGMLLGAQISGVTVEKILVEARARMDRELYFGIVFDRDLPGYALLLSDEGGVDVEETAAHDPGKVMKVCSDECGVIQDDRVLSKLQGVGLLPAFIDPFMALFRGFFDLAMAKDLTLLEINPLGLGQDGQFVIADAKIIADDNALFRHEDLRAFEAEDPESPVEVQARAHGLSYVKLGGSVGCIVNGAGLAMATMDAIRHYGGCPANFLDVGGSSSPEKTTHAMNLIVSDPSVKSILINIFGGITRCDDVARGLLAAAKSVGPTQLCCVRLSGTNEDAARRILDEAGISSATTMEEAVRRAVEAARGEATGKARDD